MEAQETHYGAPGVTLGADYVRVAQYNLMIKTVECPLKQTTPNLSHSRETKYTKPWTGTVPSLEPKVGKAALSCG